MDSSSTEGTGQLWHTVALMLALASALFLSLEAIPMVLEGAAGTILSVIVGGVFLFYFGKQTGTMLASSDA
jgi:hypothetical protein